MKCINLNTFHEIKFKWFNGILLDSYTVLEKISYLLF